jgi:integrase/recombinase XerD
MQQRTVIIMLRVKEGHGIQPYYPAVVTPNGTIKPFYARINGSPVHREDGVYYLRYRDNTGRRHYQFAGTDPKLARVMQLQRQHVIAGEEMGLPTVNAPPAIRPKRVLVAEPPSVAPFVNPKAPPAEGLTNRFAIAPTIDKFVREMSTIRSRGRAYGCRLQLGLFLRTFKKTYLDEIDDDDVVAFVAMLRDRNLTDRTIANYCATLNTFLRRYGYKEKVKKRLVPKPTEKKVCAYSTTDLKSIFKSATPEEDILFRFFLGLGMREREVMFSAWKDIDFERGLYHVTEKTDVGFTIKDKEERLIPIPSQLLEQLRKRHENRMHQRWIFPTERGQPDGHMLRRLQQLGLRAKLNCGECRTKKGISCRVDASCKRLGLHKFRKTFATLHHEKGVSIRTLMSWLGHADLETTIRYLAAADPSSEQTRMQVDKTWDSLE